MPSATGSTNGPTVKFDEHAATTIAAIKTQAKETLRSYLRDTFPKADDNVINSRVDVMIDGGKGNGGGKGPTEVSTSAYRIVDTARKKLAQGGWEMTDAVWSIDTPSYQADTLKMPLHARVEKSTKLKWRRVFSTQLCSLELEPGESAEDQEIQDVTMTDPEPTVMITDDQKVEEDSMEDPMDFQEILPAEESEEKSPQTVPIRQSLLDQFSSQMDDIFQNGIESGLDECDRPSIRDWHKNAKRLYPSMCSDLLTDLGVSPAHDGTAAPWQVHVQLIAKAATGYVDGVQLDLLSVPLRGTVTYGEQTLGSSDWDLTVDNERSAKV